MAARAPSKMRQLKCLLSARCEAMGGCLSDEDVARYRGTGCLFPIAVFGREEAADHRRRLEAAESTHGPMHYRTKPYLILSTANEIARHPVLLDAVEAVLGPDILLWDSAYVIKEAHDTRFVSWHQDLTYWGLDSDRMVTAWVALSPATPQSGCMRFVPGSHVGGKRPHHDTHASQNLLHRGQEMVEPIDEAKAVDILLEPGEASLHHGWVMHASHPNSSDDRRIGLTLQYVAPSVRQLLTDRESATLVRGVDTHRHFRPEPAFTTDFAPEAVAFQLEAERLKHAVYDTA